MQVRDYGSAGPAVVLLHGGPGAPGYLAPVGRALADRFRVVEPFARRSDGGTLSVAGHVADLDVLVRGRWRERRPALVGHSWGAMLALAYAAAHPRRVGALVLVGCGTFDPASRRALKAAREARLTADLRRRLQRLEAEVDDPDRRLAAIGRLMLPVDSYDLATTDLELGPCDARGHHETWDDMLRLQAEGVYPAAFAAIAAPVLMLHGAADPHPGRLIRSSLAPYLPQLAYHELERCGHYPWLERAAGEEFFAVLRRWLELAIRRRA
ncbi:MAG: alpha/beta hydrolase [Acidobacteria bacterium]|nr:MAG: alpha/beta hydrolase [Acidobacteriota bacterium]